MCVNILEDLYHKIVNKFEMYLTYTMKNYLFYVLILLHVTKLYRKMVLFKCKKYLIVVEFSVLCYKKFVFCDVHIKIHNLLIKSMQITIMHTKGRQYTLCI